MQNVVFYGNENAMTIIPIKATYGFKKDYISVTKPGYILIEVIPVEKSPSGEAREVCLNVYHRALCHGRRRSPSV
jgi:hypothetical protein